MKLRETGYKNWGLLILSVFLGLIAAAWSVILHHRNLGAGLQAFETGVGSDIVRSRRVIPHHLSQFVHNQVLFSVNRDIGWGEEGMNDFCSQMMITLTDFYPGLMALRCYDETFTARQSALARQSKADPVKIGRDMLILHMGASIREGLFFDESGVDYRVVVPIIHAQRRLGLVEFILTPSSLLAGSQEHYPGTWQWQRHGDEELPQRVRDGSSRTIELGPDLFSQADCHLIFTHSSRYDSQARHVLAIVLSVLSVLFLLLTFFLLLIGARSYKQESHRNSKRFNEQDLNVLSQAVEQSNVAVMVTDISGRIEYVNQKFLQLTGFDREDLLGQNPRILKSLVTPPDVYTDLWNTLSLGKAWSGEFYNRKKSGELFWDATFIAPVRDESGTVVHYVAVKEDITARKQMEVELIAAKESAETANRAKSYFLANMSHEIRTPMNTVIGMTELTLKSDLDEEQRTCLKSVLQAAGSLLSILDEILDLSSMEAGGLRLDETPFMLREQLRYWMNGTRHEAEMKGLVLLLDVDAEVPDPLVGDFIRLGQVFSNLLSNAVKFTDSGGVLVRVERSGAEDFGTLELHCTVSDTGVGVDGDMKREIFEKFSQADASSTRRFGGTGLGLTVCLELVRLMKGRIWLDSPSEWSFGGIHGQGSSFHFTVGLGRQSERNNPYRIDLTLGGRYQQAIILLVNQMQNKMVKKWCEMGGLSTRIACGFKEAWQWFVKQPKTLLLVDRENWPDDFHYANRMSEINRIIVFNSANTSWRPENLEVFSASVCENPLSAVDLMEQISSPPSASAAQIPDDVSEAFLFLQGKMASVLVAEDNPLNQKLMRRLLEKAGCRVAMADNGRKALEWALQNPCDLILMDIQMPEMDGVSATIKLRQEGFDHPIIALTAHALKGDREKCLDAGMDDYLCKPVHQDDLYAVLSRYLNRAD